MISTDDLRHKTITGIIWTFFEQIFRVGIQTITTIILAWFLLPEDFGLLALIAVFFAIANCLIDSGFSQALIRKKEVTQTDYSTAFYTNLLLGLIAYLLLFMLAPTIANFYSEIKLVTLIRVMGLVVVINSFQLVQVADLTRKLDFKAQFKIALLSSILSCIAAIFMAIMGFGVWSLIAQMMIASFISTVLYWIINEWRPSKNFNFRSLHEMFGFGSKLLVSGVMDTAFQNIYVILIGKLFSVTLVGYYFFAERIQLLIITQLTGAVQKVTYPALSSVQDNNNTLKAFYQRIIQVVVYIVFPCMIALAVLSKSLFILILNEEWLSAVPFLQILCIAGLLYPLHSINLNILKVKGRSDIFLYLEIIKKFMIVGIILCSLQFGIFGILIGQIVSSLLAYIPNSYFSIKLIDYSLTEQLHDVVPTLLLAATMGIIMYYVDLIISLGELADILVIGLVGLIFYFSANYLLNMPAQIIILQTIKERYFKKSMMDIKYLEHI